MNLTVDPPSTKTASFKVFSFLFVFSGFSALVYQILWHRILTLFGGGDIYAATIMVAAYMLGLGLGSTIGGQIADRHAHHKLVTLFAICEIAIGFFALGSVWLYHNFLMQHLSYLVAQSRLALSLILFAGFLFPTILMGMSLPLLSKSFSNRIDDAPRIISYLYSFNTLGAAVGAFFTTWFLIRNFAIERSIQFGALLNFLIGFAVLLSSRSNKTNFAIEERAAVDRKGIEDHQRIFLYLIVYALSGFLALSLEMMWFRLLGVVLKASTFIYGQLLSIYLLGLGSGSIVGNYFLKKTTQPWRSFLYFQFGIYAYSVLMIIVLIHVSEITVFPSLWKYLVAYDPIDLEQVLSGKFSKGFFALYLLTPSILIFPATFMMGLSYPFIQKVIQNDQQRIGRHVGWLHTASYVGSVAGVIITAFVFFHLFGTVQTFKILLLLSSIFLMVLIVTSQKIVPALSVLIVGLLLWRMPSADYTWGKLHGVDEKSVIHAEDTTGLTVLRASTPDFSQAIVFSNGIGIGEIPYFDFHVLLAMLPVMFHPNPDEVAIIGLGSGGTLFSTAGRADTNSITCYEIISSQKSVLDRYAKLHKPTQLLLNETRIRYQFGDARLLMRLKPEKYDVIETDPIRPDGAYSGNLYSIEYFTLLRSKLKHGGVAVNWAPTPRTAYTFIKAFPHVLYLWMPGAILIGSNDPIEWDLEAVKTRLNNQFSIRHYNAGEIKLDNYMKQLEIVPKVFGPDFDRSNIVDFNTDLYPKDEYLVKQSMEFP